MILGAMLLVPTADAYYGRIKLERLCATEGGLKVYKTAEGVDGFFSPFAGATFLEKHAFKFIGSGDRHSGFVRYRRAEGGTVLKEEISELSSRYEYRKIPGESRDTYMKNVSQVVMRDTGEVLGEVVRFSFAGGWVERALAAMLGGRGNGGVCDVGYPEQVQQQLVSATLKPPRP